MDTQIAREPTWWEPLSDGQLIVLAKMTLMWSRIDHHIDMLASLYLRTTISIWYAITGDMTLPGKIAMLVRICAKRDDPFSARLKSICAQIGDISHDRNLATHGQWMVSQPGGQVEARSPKKAKLLKVEELDGILDILTTLELDCWQLEFEALRGGMDDPRLPPEGWYPVELRAEFR